MIQTAGGLLNPIRVSAVFGPLTLGVIKISGNGDHHAVELAGQRFSGPGSQRRFASPPIF
jgi:hypothetical protein